MERTIKAILGMAMLPVCLFAQQTGDTQANWDKELNLNEVVVVGERTVLKQSPDRIVYLTRNDPFAKGLNGMEVLDRMPRVSVTGDLVNVAGKSSVRYIVDGRLLDIPDNAIAQQLKNLQASGIEKIELLTTPPAKYAAGTNVAYISITTRNETLGSRGSLWGMGSAKESFNYMLGGNVSHTTRRVELSADASWSDIKGINDLDRSYTFADHVKLSTRSNHFTNRQLGANALFKYKFTSSLCAGTIVNFSSSRFTSRLEDVTTERNAVFHSYNYSPAKPNNALTLTAFADWQLDPKGKMLSLTYNFFNKLAKTFSDVTTAGAGEETRLTNDGRNRYHIHSAKLDASLPFKTIKMEAGAAFTAIGNNTSLRIDRLVDGQWVVDPTQSNAFDYDENTAAAYISAEKSFSNSLFMKIGLRYEHTKVKGHQAADAETTQADELPATSHSNSYGYLFPSLNISWNSQKAGRLSLSYSMGITRPNFADLNPFRYYTTTNDYVSGNPDLHPSVAHNAEISYSHKGIYAVLYNSYSHNSIGYITRFGSDGSQHTIPENCIDNNKAGLYASYNRSLFGCWSINVAGEVFWNYAKSSIADFREHDDSSWSGKLELNNSWMLNRRKTLILSLRFSHYFPYHERMTSYESMSLIGCDLRYTLLGNRLTLTASVNDPFGWNITKSTALYDSYSVYSRNNIHSRSFSLRIAYNFGRDKVNGAYRDTKERESSRSY